MLKTILFFIAKLLGYFLILFAWFRIAAPFLISYPSNTLVIVGFLGSAIVVLTWVYFFVKTCQKFLIKINK